MAATTAGAVKAWLESAGLGVSVYRDAAPQGATRPYVTVMDRVSVTQDSSGGDYGEHTPTVVEQIQVDVWQTWRDPASNAVAESYTLAESVIRSLHGASLPAAPTHVYGVRLSSAVRLREPDANIVHDAITLDVLRRL